MKQSSPNLSPNLRLPCSRPQCVLPPHDDDQRLRAAKHCVEDIFEITYRWRLSLEIGPLTYNCTSDEACQARECCDRYGMDQSPFQQRDQFDPEAGTRKCRRCQTMHRDKKKDFPVLLNPCVNPCRVVARSETGLECQLIAKEGV
jgi:hypothetical protein